MLTMTAPYKYIFAPYKKYFSSSDWVKASLDLLGGNGKIGKFRYAPVIGPDIFSAIIVNTTGKSVLDFANENLLEPLGINIPGNIEFHNKEEQMDFYNSKTTQGWVVGPTGVHTGGWGLVLKPSDMLKIGQLLLNKGKWNGQQLISEKWLLESTTQKVQWKNLKYGYLWWVIDENEHSFAALGDGGNVIYVNPSQELVVVIASYFNPNAEDRMKLIKECIEPLWSN
jgi:CubicO group peptidase (beta-lactamase class C family)